MRLSKSRHRSILCALMVVLFAVTRTVPAQTTLFTYSGHLEFDGVPANGQFDFQFKLFDALTGGAQQGATPEQPTCRG